MVNCENDFGSRYWENRSAAYISALEGPYHANRLRMVEALIENLPLDGKHCLDFGCGEGVFSERLLKDGATVIGVDIDPLMIDSARQRLGHRWPLTELLLGGVSALVELPSNSFDYIFALNVLAYFSPDEDAEYYRQIHRILKSDGMVIVTHSNELFDMFTLNRYTVAFFEHHFSTVKNRCNVGSLLHHPDKPQRFVFGVRENPLSYRYKLASAGFTEVRQEFAILHSSPPPAHSGYRF